MTRLLDACYVQRFYIRCAGPCGRYLHADGTITTKLPKLTAAGFSSSEKAECAARRAGWLWGHLPRCPDCRSEGTP